MSAQLNCVDNESTLPNELLLVLDKAEQFSKRSGWAWSVTSLGKRVHSGCGMFGYHESGLVNFLASGITGDTLFLSSPPHVGFCSWEQLLPKLKAARIKEINIPVLDAQWWILDELDTAVIECGIRINRFSVKHIGSELYYGPFTLKEKLRPWITCITTNTISPSSTGLVDLPEDFGYKLRILRKILGSHALVTDPRIDCQYFEREFNDAKCEILRSNFSGIENFQRFLSQLAKLDLSTLVVVVSEDICQQLVALGLVDEISMSYEFISGHENRGRYYPHTLPSSWKVVDCSPITRGVYVELINKPF